MRGLHIFLLTAIPQGVPVYTTSGSELLHGDLHELAEAGVLLQLLGDLDAFVFILTERDPEAIHVYKVHVNSETHAHPHLVVEVKHHVRLLLSVVAVSMGAG